MSTTRAPRRAFPGRIIFRTGRRAAISTGSARAASSARSRSGSNIGTNCASAPLFPPLRPRGRRGGGEEGEGRALGNTHLTLTARRAGPLPLPPEGRRGEFRRLRVRQGLCLRPGHRGGLFRAELFSGRDGAPQFLPARRARLRARGQEAARILGQIASARRYFPLSAPGGGEGGVRRGRAERWATPTSPSQRAAPGPSLSPLKGGEGNFGVFGYGKGYVYDPGTEEGFSGQNYFPDGTARRNFYRLGARGFEREVKKRLEYWDKLRQRAAISPSPPPGAERAG